MTVGSPFLLEIALNVNGLNYPICAVYKSLTLIQ